MDRADVVNQLHLMTQAVLSDSPTHTALQRAIELLNVQAGCAHCYNVDKLRHADEIPYGQVEPSQ
jgi:hypothetical protein